MTEVPNGWAKHYYDDPFMDRYFAHKYHWYDHGRALCKRSIQRMPDQPHYAELPEDHKEYGFCGWCMVQLMRGVRHPEYLWLDELYEEYKGKTYVVKDRSKQEDKSNVE